VEGGTGFGEGYSLRLTITDFRRNMLAPGTFVRLDCRKPLMQLSGNMLPNRAMPSLRRTQIPISAVFSSATPPKVERVQSAIALTAMMGALLRRRTGGCGIFAFQFRECLPNS
jgi:hypothetical protein